MMDVYRHIRDLECQLSWTFDQISMNNQVMKVYFMSSQCHGKEVNLSVVNPVGSRIVFEEYLAGSEVCTHVCVTCRLAGSP